MTLLLRAARLALGAAVVSAVIPACYTAGGGTAPPTNTFYFPTGLAVSQGGNVLYAINSDFDLQWNGGTLQSYDLFQIRQDTASLIQDNLSGSTTPPPNIPFVLPWQPNCPYNPPPPTNDLSGEGLLLGEACAPAVDSTPYVRDSAIVGAFATDLQTSIFGVSASVAASTGAVAAGTRLFAPVSGNATVTWADVGIDDPSQPPNEDVDQAQCGQPGSASQSPFTLCCGPRVDDRCDAAHATGNDVSQPGDTRLLTMPGEPFGLGQSQDGTAMVVTSETATQTSLLTTGFAPGSATVPPALQFVVDQMPNGGVSAAAVPHDPNAVIRCEDVGDQQPCTRQAFLQVNRGSTEVDLLRYYDDQGASLYRPFLQKERSYTINTNSAGSDARGIAIDPSQRLACEAQQSTPKGKMLCAEQYPARVFIANRTPPSIVVGQIGLVSNTGDGTYDPDALIFTNNVSLTAGPSKIYLAPVVMKFPDGLGHYVLRLFVVCFDTSTVFIFDPNDLGNPLATPEALVYTGAGPYALAFDPFSMEDVATNAVVPVDPRAPPSLALKRYRFAYVASFTQSYLQVIDLDQDSQDPVTWEHVVFTLGKPTPPKGQ
ncbi:MAG TPA: hypothetical protein VGL81_00740 [Polyangiaceae bacterium]|jgi:hypothetical protein